MLSVAASLSAKQARAQGQEDQAQDQSIDMYLYIGIPVALVMLYLAYTLFAGKGADVDDGDQLTLSDVVSKDISAEGGEFLDAEDKLLKALDQQEMDFEKELSGNLTKDGFCNLRNLITAMTQ